MTLRIHCRSCNAEIRTDNDSCPKCGVELNPTESDATRRLESPQQRSTSSSFDSIDNARFVPGAIIAERYRIVGLLGRGGMGEVYRADDLKLSQPVALKFLPEHLLSDGAALARFHREVRVARQVSHKNVCRVYDIGEVTGRHFLSMEFIKGEELSSFMRRIGRLPQDKAVQIARQICAGLGAAHDAGVLHRDLKPANVMIDERGDARITDFGLAGLAEEFGDDELAAGTPAYMAPEQLSGKEQSVKTDIYSLGLVLYELFTGKKAFDAATMGELLKLRRSNTPPTTPTDIVKDLDPLVEKVIDRCLQTDPSQRPASALQVAAALPGGDPIAAALAAGETPSPEMVAAAPKQGILRPQIAIALFLSMLILLAIALWMTRFTTVYRMTSLDKPPAALRAQARDVVSRLGYPETPADSVDGIILKRDYLEYVAANDQSADRWQKMRGSGGPGPYRYWYRQSPRLFDTIEEIEVDKPALDVSGMASMYLDMQGRLHWFMAVPPQREPPIDPNALPNLTPDWSLPFREAGLDIANFKSVPSTSIPLHAYDARAAWDGPDPAHPELITHVEAAAFHGKLVYFETVYPWDQPLRQEEPPQKGSWKALTFIMIAIYLVALFGSLMLARRNLRLGRGDRHGATRVALVYFTVAMLMWLFIEHHNGLPVREFSLFSLHLATALLDSTFLWLLYVALEPFIRRRWPAWIISWSRLLAGDFRDPLVGRDILIGAAIGALFMLVLVLSDFSPKFLSQPPELEINPGSMTLGNFFFLRFAGQVTAGLFVAFISVFLLLLFTVILRRERLAVLALWLLFTLLFSLVTEATWIRVPFAALLGATVVFPLIRFGLLAVISTLFFSYLTVYYPITTELTAWYATDFTIALAIALVIAAYGFYTSLGGQKLLSGKLLED